MQYQRINIGHLIGKDTLDVNIKWSWRKRGMASR
jgi:hypothetical protein